MSEQPGLMESKVLFELPDDMGWSTVPPETPLVAAAQQAGVLLNLACAGDGRCGGCAVDLVRGRFIHADGRVLTPEPGKPLRELSCQIKLDDSPGQYVVRVPAHSMVRAGEQVVADYEHFRSWRLSPAVRQVYLTLSPPTLGESLGDVERIVSALSEQDFHPVDVSHFAVTMAPRACGDGDYKVTAMLMRDGQRWRLADVAPGDARGGLYGLAIDIGTTTVVCALVDLSDGKVVDAVSSYNRQIITSADVAGRIHCVQDPADLFRMQELLNSTLEPLGLLLRDRAGLDDRQIVRVAISGNTVMTHLALMADPSGLGAVPFAPAIQAPPAIPAGTFGLACHCEALAEFAPAVSAYVGGDAVSDLYACGFDGDLGRALLVDIGTNAEIVLSDGQTLWACSAPAGPAFEGSWIHCGMRAAIGAIDAVAIDPDTGRCECTVIGGGKPVGLCGSGLIDFVAQARQAGLLSAAGRFTPGAAERCDTIRKVALPDGSEALAYVLAEIDQTDDCREPVLLTERDIATLLQAKGVIYAAIRVAAKQAGVELGAIERIFLAGGFARHVDLDNAIAMGMLPDLPRERFAFVGNGSLAGAVLRLVDDSAAEAQRALSHRPRVIELNLDPDFQDYYTEAMMLG